MREPVFQGLFEKRTEGFVQIDWQPREHQALPPVIDEQIDVDGNGTADLRIRVDTKSNSTRLTPLQPWVIGEDKLIVAQGDRILRIRLRNPR